MANKDKTWFQSNVVLDTTKIVLAGWENEYLIVTNIDDNEFFVCNNHKGKTGITFPYALDWSVYPSMIDITDATEQAIDASYNKKIADGQAYYRKKRAELLKDVVNTVITEADADFIDVALKEVSAKINTGDWKSAKKRLDETVVSGAYTQAIKDAYIAEIDAYIAANY